LPRFIPLLPAYTILYGLLPRFIPLLPAYTILQQRRIVKTLAASLRHFMQVKDSEKPLLPAYDILHGLLPV
jgi:hypothetical protein